MDAFHILTFEPSSCLQFLVIHFLNVLFLLIPKHAANLEQKQNEAENKKVHGDVVKYGSVIQVGTHIWSKLYLLIISQCVSKNCKSVKVCFSPYMDTFLQDIITPFNYYGKTFKTRS